MSDLKKINEQWIEADPKDIMLWALAQSKNPILTTNFRPYEIAIYIYV
jgi:phosphoadenosine phosphosulfate reductase